jgi:hypothetical protein
MKRFGELDDTKRELEASREGAAAAQSEAASAGDAACELRLQDDAAERGRARASDLWPAEGEGAARLRRRWNF